MGEKKWMFIGAIMVFLVPSACFSQEDFNAALDLHLSTFSPSVSSAGIGGTWVATPYPSSHNAACLTKMSDYEISPLLCTSPTFYQFGSGPEIGIWLNSVSFDIRGRHFFRVASFNARSEKSPARNGLDTKLKLDISEIAYGYYVSPKLSLGASIYPFRDIDVKGDFQGIPFFENQSRANLNARIGLLYEPVKDVFFGANFQYTKENVRNKTLNPAAGSYLKSGENYYSKILRLGASWRPWKGGLVSLDRQFGEVDGPGGDKSAGKWFLGLEQGVLAKPAVLLRIGSLDGSPSFGLGVYHKNRIFFDYAYINKANRDLEPFFGDSYVHMVSLAVSF